MQSVLRFHRVFVALTAVAAVAAIVSLAAAYPEPNRVPTRWELDFEPGPLRLYIDRTSADPAAYWYMTYKVVNNTGEDRFWAPQFTLFADTGEITGAGERVPMAVERAIQAMLGNELLERQIQAIGKIHVGEPNAIDALVVWPADDLDVTELSVFVSGISGETAAVTNPVTGEKVVLQKTLKRDYVVPGDPAARGDDPVPLANETWVMR